MQFVRSALLGRSALIALAAAVTVPAHAQETSPAADEGDAIVITGTRLSLRAATAEKRGADNFVEALQANDVGKLPDQNVAEAVKRLPGLSVANDQGEGRYVIIRGIDPSLVTVALNGQTLPAPEPGARQVKLDDLPSAMIQSVTVTKSLLPSQDANAIGGEVNIRTRTAFDAGKDLFFDGRAAAGWYKLNKKSPYEADGTIGGRFGAAREFGAVVSVNYSHRPIESENFQGTTTYKAIAADINAPDQAGLRDYNLTRTRLGIVGNLDWKPSNMVHVYLRSSYSRFTDDEIRDQNRLDTINYGTSTTATGALNTARANVLVRARQEHDNTKSVTLGTEIETKTGKLEWSGGWTKAVKEDPLRSEFRFRSAAVAMTGSSYDVGADPFIISPFFLTNLAAYVPTSLNIETRQAAETVWQTRVDYTIPVGMGDSSIKVGYKFLQRKKTNNQDRTNFTFAGGATAFPLAAVSFTGDTSFYDGRYTFGPRIDYWAARGYVDSHAGVAVVNTTSSISDTLANDSDVRETIHAAYAMATIKAGDWTIIPGLRVEHTADQFFAKGVSSASTLTSGFNSTGQNSYTNFFPGVNVKFEPIRNLLLRAAVTTSLGRPNYASLAPAVLVDTAPTVPVVTTGNPELKPYRAVNYDASIEYYPNKDSVFSVGFFHKDIKDPIYSRTDRLTGATFAGVTYSTADVIHPVNLDSEVITGVEANVQTQFSFLPGFLGGFGVSANYAHVWGHASAPSPRSGTVPLGFQSNDIGNVQLFFEKYGLAARVAVNYRSAYLDTLGGSVAQDQYTDANAQIDVHVSYEVMPQATVFADATNLTDAPWRRYVGTSNLLVEREHYGASFRGGVQVHF